MRAPGSWNVAYRSGAWRIIAALRTSSCASRRVPPMGADGKPFKPESDELRLRAQAEKEEEQLQKKTKPYDDPLLDEYLGKIGDKLLPDDVRAAGGPGFRLRVLPHPPPNALALPNRRIYRPTRLLARLRQPA